MLVYKVYTDKLEFLTTPPPLAVDTGSDADVVTGGAENFDHMVKIQRQRATFTFSRHSFLR